MPELPEVETVRRELSQHLIGLKFKKVEFLYKPCFENKNRSIDEIIDAEITSLSRKGKYLIFNLSNEKLLVFHLRMEGKLFFLEKESADLKRCMCKFEFSNDNEHILTFNDVRKFGRIYLLDDINQEPLSKVGAEPMDIDPKYVYESFHSKNLCLKELLLRQDIMSGIGNIYADEVCFDCSISPFRLGNTLTKTEVDQIVDSASRILKLAIQNNGSTVRSYQFSDNHRGSFQNFLKVYGKEGTTCSKCGNHKIKKIHLSGRGTSFCPHCQHNGLNIAVTGKIASGKSLACSYFAEYGFVRFSADEEVHRLYQDDGFLKELKAKFPIVFTPDLDKKKITKLLSEKAFYSKYCSFVFGKVKEAIEKFIVENDGKDKVFEIPLLFDAHFEKYFDYLIGTETTRQDEHLKERNESSSRKSFNEFNSYDDNRNKLNYILSTDGTKEELKSKVCDLISSIRK